MCDIWCIDESFWTREDLDEFIYELEEQKELKSYNYKILGSFMENDNRLEIDIVDENDNEYTFCEKIDMRKIKNPNDLQKVYKNCIYVSIRLK